ncbi:hypothetical protein INR49_017171 [Caranx melampygus]|nr:hypothetical protein INR49_017171 [Caranx melampygus]
MPQTLRPISCESIAQTSDKRASSPESMPEFNENRSLSPDSPIPQFAVSWEGYTMTHWSSDPESLASDSECELIVTSPRAADTERSFSPESISSISEFRKLLPDSPVPEFMRILSSYFMDGSPCDRSSSPVSLSSDTEFVALPIDCWIDDSPRPLSPQTAESEEDLGFGCEDSEWLLSKPQLIQTREGTVKEGHVNPAWQIRTGADSDILSCEEWMQQRSEETGSISTLQTKVCEEDEDFPVKASPTQGENIQEKILYTGGEEVKSKTVSQWAPGHTPEDTHFQTGDEAQSKLLSATTAARDTSKRDVLFDDGKPVVSVPLQLPELSSYTTHRTVTPVVSSLEQTLCRYSESELSSEEAQSSELFSPMSSQFLAPPDYEAVFSGHQTLRVSECSQASLKDLSPVSPVFSDSAEVVAKDGAKRASEASEDFKFSPGFEKVCAEFEKTVLELESEEPKVPPKEVSCQSPLQSDSDLEFFDCRQGLSDLSDPEEGKLDPKISYHVLEPTSPAPGSSPDVSFLKGSTQYTHTFRQGEDYKRFSSGSESLGEFAYDSEGSRGGRAEGNVLVCEELPSRDQAGYYNDDDFLGREIAEELGMLSDSSEEEVLTTRVVRRRVIIQGDNLPDIPAQTVTEEKYTDEHGNMVVKKITRKVIHKCVSADGTETQEVTIEGSHQETVQIEEGDALTFSEPLALCSTAASQFEVEPVQGRKVSKVVKTTVVRGERMEKQMGDPSLAADLPSAREDFEKALRFAGGFGKALVPHVVEKEVVQDDGSVIRRLDSA